MIRPARAGAPCWRAHHSSWRPPCSRRCVSRGRQGAHPGPLLARVFDRIYDADFAGADAELTRACGPAPAQACDVVGIASQWWRLYLDIDNRSRDASFTSRVDAVIAAGERWVAREPERAEAWFYLGAAYGVRVQFHAQRSEFLAAARDGKRIKLSLEKALALDPGLDDANAGLGPVSGTTPTSRRRS